MKRTLDKQNGVGSESVTLNINPSDKFHTGVKALTLFLTVVFTNANAGAQTVTSEKFFQNSKITLKTRVGGGWLSNFPLRFLEFIDNTFLYGEPSGSGVMADITGLVGSGTNGGVTTKTFKIHIPVQILQAARPEDYIRSLAHIGTCEVMIGATGNANVVVSSFSAELLAEVIELDHTPVGTEWIAKVEQAQGGTLESVMLANRPLVHCIMVTKDQSRQPLNNITGLEITLDDGPALAKLKDTAITELAGMFANQFIAAPHPGDQPTSQTAPLLCAPAGFNLADLPHGNKLSIEFADRNTDNAHAVAAGDQQFLVISLKPRNNRVLPNMVPGNRTAAEIVRAATPVRANPNGSAVSPRLEPFLPLKVFTPTMTAAARVGA